MRAAKLYPKDRVVLREVGFRDGLQLVKQPPPTAQKKEWLNAEHAAGVRHFEVGSFLPVARFPQFADVREMIDAVSALKDGFSSALALNERGAADALATGVDEIMFVVSATEAHSQANTRRSRAEAVEMAARINRRRLETGDTAPVFSTAISMSFGCTLSGTVKPAEVLRLAEALAAAGSDMIALADTVGFAGPRQVAQMAREMRGVIGEIPVSMHFHDTRGLAIANCAAALDNGVRILDGSLGGLGGCPFAPGATGNVAFEDMAFLCQTMGFDTGIDIGMLADARTILERVLPDEPLHGALAVWYRHLLERI